MSRIFAVFALLFVLALPSFGGDADKTYRFALDEWHPIEEIDGPITLHRIRLDNKEGRWTKSTLARPHNQEFLETILIQLEYTNEGSKKWKARLEVRWLDEDDEVIDGFTANETLEKKSARDVVQVSVSTLAYGVKRARNLEVKVHFVP